MFQLYAHETTSTVEIADAGSTHLPCSRIKSCNRSTASASGILNFSCLADVEIHLAGRAAYVTKVSVRHFTGAVHNSAHDRDLHAFKMRRRRFDLRGGCLQIK